MAGTNKDILDQAFKDYELYICDKTEDTLREWCDDLLYNAVKWRVKNPEAHNFTGNLLNSIVVGLYRERACVYACYAAGQVPKAIRPKMTARRYAYHFRWDYDKAQNTRYKAEVQTDRGWGEEDAEKFVMSYKPDGHNLFDIVVAYTVEYADWVNMQRGTTGIMQTWQQAKISGMTFMQLA